MDNQNNLTTEQQLIYDIAQEHHKKHGRDFAIQHIVGHAIAGSEEVQVYLVIGSINALCNDCKQIHQKGECLVFFAYWAWFHVIRRENEYVSA